MAQPVTSFKKFLKKRAPIFIATLPHRKKKNSGTEEMKAFVNNADSKQIDMRQNGEDRALRNDVQKESLGQTKTVAEALHARTPAKSGEADKLHGRLAKHYQLDDKDKEAVDIYSKFGNHINKQLTKGAMPEEERSKPAPKNAEDEKLSADAQAAGKQIDKILSQHKSPTADFYCYAAMPDSPADKSAETTGYDNDPNGGPIEGSIPGFTETSLDINVAKEMAGKKGHILKLKIPAGSKHGVYTGEEDSKKFLIRPGRQTRIHPEPEQHGDHQVWHGELQGDK